MNICADVAVNPSSGAVAVVGTDGINEVRFEPVLNGIFSRIKLALVSADGEPTPRVLDLNPHIAYDRANTPLEERRKSVGDPRGITWNASGTLAYVTGMGSDNLVALNAEGERVAGPVSLPSGPTGVLHDGANSNLYVFSRFAAVISVLDPDSLEVKQEVALFDPTPAAIRKGRPHFYNTIKNSGLGQASCASCHPDARMDRLAWDLGSQLLEIKPIGAQHNFGNNPLVITNDFHPLKGPMVTQTLQDIIGHEPFHWRGDRDGLEEFNATFKELQGADEELTDAELQEFEDFLATITLPPNRFRNFDNSLPLALPLDGHVSLGRGNRFKGDPLPTGNAQRGLARFRAPGASNCTQCHTLPTGMGADRVFHQTWRPIPVGPNGEHHLAMSATERSEMLPFKIAQLRTLPDKIGFDVTSSASLSGFGFFHDGRVDSLTRFLQDGFGIFDDQETADMIAFLLAFSGSDLPIGSINDINHAPGVHGKDVPAATGRQVWLTEAKMDDLDLLLSRATSMSGRLELVVKSATDEGETGWWFDRGINAFRSDTGGLSSIARLKDLVGSRPMLATLVPRGTGRRLAIDRDLDGILDAVDEETGSAPAVVKRTDGASIRLTSISLSGMEVRVSWVSRPGGWYRVVWRNEAGKGEWQEAGEWIEAESFATEAIVQMEYGVRERYFRVEEKP